MLIQVVTISVIACFCCLYTYILSNIRSSVIEKIVSIYAISVGLRLSWLQWEWIQIALVEEMRKSFEWGAHDIALSGFLAIVSLYILSNIKHRSM